MSTINNTNHVYRVPIHYNTVSQKLHSFNNTYFKVGASPKSLNIWVSLDDFRPRSVSFYDFAYVVPTAISFGAVGGTVGFILNKITSSRAAIESGTCLGLLSGTIIGNYFLGRHICDLAVEKSKEYTNNPITLKQSRDLYKIAFLEITGLFATIVLGVSIFDTKNR